MHSTNPHLDGAVFEWGGDGDSTLAVLAVHGRTQTPDFMREQADRLDVSHARFFAPRAWENTWYPKPFLEPIHENQPALGYALDAVDARIDDLLAHGFQTDRVVLWGFSQGACLLAHHCLTRPRPIGGLILYTGGFIGPGRVDPIPRSLTGVPTVMRSIENDPFVPAHRVRETADALRVAGSDVDVLVAPGDEHIITEEAIDAGRTLLARLA
ncbi:alpha/beta hydrolase [Gordonia sp. NPDC127522]|uniref:alpha/beta hydrolase n=1 Tax=Gordonia sp. NPDC127522 TaxID=3345390 RepID=UPI003643CF12